VAYDARVSDRSMLILMDEIIAIHASVRLLVRSREKVWPNSEEKKSFEHFILNTKRTKTLTKDAFSILDI
jgi:hypothetical protein